MSDALLAELQQKQTKNKGYKDMLAREKASRVPNGGARGV